MVLYIYIYIYIAGRGEKEIKEAVREVRKRGTPPTENRS